MKKTLRFTACLVCLVFLLTNLVACGGNTSTTKDESTAVTTKQADTNVQDTPKEKVTLKYMMWDPAVKDKEVSQIIRPFEEKNPKIKIDIQALPWGDYWKKVQVMCASNTPPDVFYMSGAYNWEFAQKGLIKNLTPLINADPEMAGLNDFFAPLMGMCKYPDENGDIYAFPYSWIASVLFYNKTMFDKAGVSYPTDDWTWDNLVDAARKLTKGEGPKKQYGFLSGFGWEVMDSYINTLGGQVLTPDLRDCKLNDPLAVEGIQFFYDLIYKEKVSPSPAQLKGAPDQFLTGKVAMTVAGSFNIENYRTIKDFDWDIAMVPVNAKTGKRVIYGGPDPVVIGEKTKHPNEAWLFLKYFCKDQPLSALMGGKVPINKASAGSEEWLEKDKKPAHKDVILKSVEYLKGADFGYKWLEWRATVMNNEIEPAFDNKKTVKEAADTATQKIKAILDEMKNLK